MRIRRSRWPAPSSPHRRLVDVRSGTRSARTMSKSPPRTANRNGVNPFPVLARCRRRSRAGCGPRQGASPRSPTSAPSARATSPWALTAAPCSMSKWTRSALPVRAAVMNTVSPSADAVFGFRAGLEEQIWRPPYCHSCTRAPGGHAVPVADLHIGAGADEQTDQFEGIVDGRPSAAALSVGRRRVDVPTFRKDAARCRGVSLLIGLVQRRIAGCRPKGQAGQQRQSKARRRSTFIGRPTMPPVRGSDKALG